MLSLFFNEALTFLQIPLIAIDVIIAILFKGLIIFMLALNWIHIFEWLSCKTQNTEI